MIAKGAKIVDYIEVFFEDKTKRPLALIYVIAGYGEFIRRDAMWIPRENADTEIFDGAEYIVLEKRDAITLDLKTKFDRGEHVSRDEVFQYRTDKYDGL